MWRRRRGPRGRPPKPVRLGITFSVERFIPVPQRSLEPVYLGPAELEAVRLVDLESVSQEEAGERMGVSRGTIWRLLKSARTKIIKAIVEARPLIVSTGENIK